MRWSCKESQIFAELPRQPLSASPRVSGSYKCRKVTSVSPERNKNAPPHGLAEKDKQVRRNTRVNIIEAVEAEVEYVNGNVDVDSEAIDGVKVINYFHSTDAERDLGQTQFLVLFFNVHS